ncbi:MAG TPA: hypothetical protein VF056_05300 [Thermoleophilaceae bacterium]
MAFCEYGAADGSPASFFHGWPGSRLDFAANDAAATLATFEELKSRGVELVSDVLEFPRGYVAQFPGPSR